MDEEPTMLEYAAPPAGQQVPRYAIVFYVAAAAFLLPLGGLARGSPSWLRVRAGTGQTPQCDVLRVGLHSGGVRVFIGGGVLACQEAWRVIRLRRAVRRGE